MLDCVDFPTKECRKQAPPNQWSGAMKLVVCTKRGPTAPGSWIRDIGYHRRRSFGGPPRGDTSSAPSGLDLKRVPLQPLRCLAAAKRHTPHQRQGWDVELNQRACQVVSSTKTELHHVQLGLASLSFYFVGSHVGSHQKPCVFNAHSPMFDPLHDSDSVLLD